MKSLRFKMPDASLGKRTRVVAPGAAALVSLALITGCAQTETGSTAAADTDVASALQDEGKIVVGDIGYMENSLQAYMLADIVTELGGEVEVQAVGDATVISTEMAKADNVVNMDFWRWQYPDVWENFVEKEKSIVPVGTSEYTGEEGWYVPTYVIEGDEERGIEPMCPGLPDWEALNDCADVFATSKTGDKGQYMEGAESWAPFYGDQERIDNLKLNYEMVFAGSEAALFAELARAYDRGEPWLGLMWRPNYMSHKYDLTRVEFPEHTEECWGTTYACQWPETVIYRMASAGFEDKHPTVWKILENWDVSDDRLHELQKYVVDDGMSIEDAAQKWVDDNPDVWQSWAA